MKKAKPKSKAKKKTEKWAKTDEKLAALFTDIAAKVGGCNVKMMFGSPAAFYQKKMVAGLHRTVFVFRLPEDLRNEVIEDGGSPFEPIKGRVLRDFACVSSKYNSDRSHLKKLLGAALRYTAEVVGKKKDK